MKFVLRVEAELRSRLPPTICLTAPACKSMQGRNRVIVTSLKNSKSSGEVAVVMNEWMGTFPCRAGKPRLIFSNNDGKPRFCSALLVSRSI